MSSRKERLWDEDTDELRSVASDGLSETRPNRWTGPGSTWRKLTADDRSVHTALEAVKNRDLSVHLYNAFALKRRGGFGGPDERVSTAPVLVDLRGGYGDGREN